MEKFRTNVQKHKLLIWIVLLAYIPFYGCFSFPFFSELSPLDLQRICLTILAYATVGMFFAGLLEKGKSRFVFSFTFIFTLIGLFLRYLLEYGEVSNMVNFIPINIVLFVTIIPLYCVIVYWILSR